MSHSCDGWVCVVGTVGDSSIFGLVREAGTFATVLPTFVLVSRSSLNSTVTVSTSSVHRLLHDMRQWSVSP